MATPSLIAARSRIATLSGQIQVDLADRRIAVLQARIDGTDESAPIRSRTISAGALEAITIARTKAARIR